jgi:hypothetical protein
VRALKRGEALPNVLLARLLRSCLAADELALADRGVADAVAATQEGRGAQGEGGDDEGFDVHCEQVMKIVRCGQGCVCMKMWEVGRLVCVGRLGDRQDGVWWKISEGFL